MEIKLSEIAIRKIVKFKFFVNMIHITNIDNLCPKQGDFKDFLIHPTNISKC